MQLPQDSELANASLDPVGDRGDPPRSEGSLEVRCAALTRKISELRELPPAGKSQAQFEIESLRQDKLQLQQQLEEREREFAALTEEYRSTEANLCEREQHYQQVLAEAKAVLTELGAEIARLVAECRKAKVEHLELDVPPTPGHLATAALTRQSWHDLVNSTDAIQLSEAEVPLLPPAQVLVELTERIAERDEKLGLLRAELTQKDQLIQEFQALQYAASLGFSTESVDPGEVDKLRSELARALKQLQTIEGTLSTLRLAEASTETEETSSIEEEMTRLRAELADKEKTIQNSVPASKVEELIAELDRARREVAKLQPQDPPSNQAGEVEQLKAEVILLQEELREKDRKLKVKQAMAGSPDAAEDAQIAAQYELEMVRYHRELEADRELLNGFVRDLRRRNTELAQAAERTQQELAQERSQLLMLRDELRIDLAFEDLAFLARKHLAPLRKEAELPTNHDADKYKERAKS
jgi:hypothetical protein